MSANKLDLQELDTCKWLFTCDNGCIKVVIIIIIGLIVVFCVILISVLCENKLLLCVCVDHNPV